MEHNKRDKYIRRLWARYEASSLEYKTSDLFSALASALALVSYSALALAIVSDSAFARALALDSALALVLVLVLGSALALALAFVLALALAINRHKNRSAKKSAVIRPPFSGLVRILEFLLPRKKFDSLIAGTVRDARDEVFAAVAAGQKWRARWLQVLYTGAVLVNVVSILPEFVRKVLMSCLSFRNL